jgi:ribosome-associated heat shock protein Hsp15
MERVRIDKWLWAARFFKTRSLATDAIDGGKVALNGERVKPAKEVKAGDRLEVRTPSGSFSILVKALSDKRGNASAAQLLFDETAESRDARAREAEHRKRFADPADAIPARPTKKDRRNLDRFRDA